jgi:hypothetical protein
MKIGGEYGLRTIAAKHWQKLISEAHQNPEEVFMGMPFIWEESRAAESAMDVGCRGKWC